MRAKKRATPRRLSAPRPEPTQDNIARTDRIYELVGMAERLWLRKRYRQAIDVCNELAALDPSNMTAEQMKLGCWREIHKRRAILLGAIVGLILVVAGGIFVATRVAHLTVDPPPGRLVIKEGQVRTFRFESPIALQSGYEYLWSLTDADGKPVAGSERGALRPEEGSPWVCTLNPPFNLVRAADGGGPAIRTVVGIARAADGSEILRAAWTVRLENVPSAPAILAVEPRTDKLLGIIAGKGIRAFHVEAVDSDGGTDLIYDWLVGDGTNPRSVQKGTDPEWSYLPSAEELPEGFRDIREDGSAPAVLVTCRVANRYGKPMPREVQWRKVHLVRSNAPPQLVGFEPGISEIRRIKEGERLTIKPIIYDSDKGDMKKMTYRWDIDGATVSTRSTLEYTFPYDTTDEGKVVSLHLTITDLCGASAEQSWNLVVTHASTPRSTAP